MSPTILIPLDGSKESESIFTVLQEQFSTVAELILLKVIRSVRTYYFSEIWTDPGQIEANVRDQAMQYLHDAAQRLGADELTCRCEVVVSDSIAKAIVDFAERENVDSIVMYTHDRKGLARLIRRSVAKAVQRRALLDVRMFGPRELAGVA